MTTNLIADIENLYQQLPQVNCMQCGDCCVSPTCTLAECIYMFNSILNSSTTEEIIEYLSKPLELHPDYEGNTRCMFLKDNRCAVHNARTGACRLFGVPSLKELEINELEECRKGIGVVQGNGNIEFIKEWLKQLVAIDKHLYTYETEPYFITGFSIHCWLDIFFDDTLDFDVFEQIRKTQQHYIDLSGVKQYYTLKTGIKEKIDKITIFSYLLGSGNRETIEKTLLSIKNDYPATGTYFYEHACSFLEVCRQL